MFDLSEHLRANAPLFSLLSHYARLGSDDRAAWWDRVMRMDGATPEPFTALHGELIAFDGIEQNTGNAVLLPDGRLTSVELFRVNPATWPQSNMTARLPTLCPPATLGAKKKAPGSRADYQL